MKPENTVVLGGNCIQNRQEIHSLSGRLDETNSTTAKVTCILVYIFNIPMATFLGITDSQEHPGFVQEVLQSKTKVYADNIFYSYLTAMVLK